METGATAYFCEKKSSNSKAVILAEFKQLKIGEETEMWQNRAPAAFW